MTGHALISHSPEDRETATFLASDLERQGVRVRAQAPGDEQAVHGATALIALASHASIASGQVWADADGAARAGKPLYVVRLGEVDAQSFSTMPVRQWVDAFGPQAPANVARLADALRGLAAGGIVAPAMEYPPAQGPYGAPPPQPPYGAPARSAVPTWVPVVGIVVGLAGLVGGGLKIAGAFDSAPRTSASSYSPSTPAPVGNMSGAPAAAGTSVTERPAIPAALNRQNVAGMWAFKPDCSGATITFTSDGRWWMNHGSGNNDRYAEGTYTLSGTRYTSTNKFGGVEAYEVPRFDANHFETIKVAAEPQNRSRSMRYRCSGGGASLAAAPAGGQLGPALAAAASQFRARLPMTNGTTTISDVQASGNALTMYVTIAQPVAGAWSQLDGALRSNICSGGFAKLIRQGATAVVHMQDSAGSRHSLTVNSC